MRLTLVIALLGSAARADTQLEAERRARDTARYTDDHNGLNKPVEDDDLVINGEMRKHVASLGSLSDLPLDAEGFLAEHLLVVLGETDTGHGARCAPATAALDAEWQRLGRHATAYRRLVRAKGSLAEALGVQPPQGSVSALDGCGRAVCLERGTPLASVAHWQQRFEPASTPNDTLAVFKKCACDISAPGSLSALLKKALWAVHSHREVFHTKVASFFF
jgi:hypothetical protein